MYKNVMEYVGNRDYLYFTWISVYNSNIRRGASIETAQNTAFETVTAMMQEDAAFKVIE